MGFGLLTDLYELNMAAGYLSRGMTGPATFSLFVRRLPADRGFLVAAGLADCLRFLEDFHFDDVDLHYLRDQLGFDPGTVDAFAALRFTGDVHAVPEGEVVGADEPLLEVTAPAAEAQLVETVLLNHITFQTSVASKAARCTVAARGAPVIDFAFRRTQGIEAGITVARATAIAGFAGTSNVEAARRHGLTAVGTMAHSYIEAFDDEAAAFAAFAQDRPGPQTFLVDTYDTETGVRTAIEVARRLALPYPIAVRLDSGDLAELARRARRILDEAGMPDARIFASGGLDEFAVAELTAVGAPIDAYGVGTKIGVSADAPALDSAYKLVRFGDRPVMKLSSGKVTLPGAKQVFRGPDSDLLALRDEPCPEGARPLLVPVMRNGTAIAEREPWETARTRCANAIAALPSSALRLHAPHPRPIQVSRRLTDLRDRCQARLRRGTAAVDRRDPNLS